MNNKQIIIGAVIVVLAVIALVVHSRMTTVSDPAAVEQSAPAEQQHQPQGQDPYKGFTMPPATTNP